MNHELYMQRCIDLASQALGKVAPNPMVGAVIVHDNRIIGEGFHQHYGGPHAEINAINSVDDKEILKESILYVSLEPCSHFGKTPPCTDAIIRYGIPHVVIAMKDPFKEVNGNGILKLKEAGIKVTTSVLEKEAAFLNRRFITFHQKQRPYLILKWAQSKDGYIGRHGEKLYISNEYSRTLVHRWRSEEQAIMAGFNTIIHDNPQLNVRYYTGKDPVRITIDLYNSINDRLNIFDGSQPTVVFSAVPSHRPNAETIEINPHNMLQEMLMHLCKKNIQSVLIEGGSNLLSKFINAGLWDEARIFKSDINLNSGVKAPGFPFPCNEEKTILNDQLCYCYNQ